MAGERIFLLSTTSEQNFGSRGDNGVIQPAVEVLLIAGIRLIKHRLWIQPALGHNGFERREGCQVLCWIFAQEQKIGWRACL